MKRITTLPILVLIAALFMSGCASVVSAGSVMALPALLGKSAAPAVVAEKSAASAAAPAAPASAAPVAIGSADDLQAAFEAVYQQVNPSVVNIQVAVQDTSGFLQGGSGEALGSGFVWDDQGHIVTNNHVVDSATDISVTFADGTTVSAKVVGTDPEADMAVIKVDPSAVKLQPVKMADAATLKVGQLAIAIGNPYGLSGTMTTGIVSALSRSLPVETGSSNNNLPGSGSSSGGTYTIPDIIQTDAAINPGNSGGVLVNLQGEVLGITSAIRTSGSSSSNSGIGFVIPTNIVQRVVPSLIQTGKYEHPRMGVSGTTLTADLANQIGLPDTQKGVLVINVSPNSPAAKAGLVGAEANSVSNQQTPAGGDVITAIDGQQVKSFDDLTSYLFNNTRVGQEITLTILRGGKEQSIKLTLGVLSQP